jgi:hypothetical protein
MTVKRHVVVIEDMRGDPIDERRIGNAAGFASRNKARALSYGSSAKDPVHQTDDRLGRAGHHDRVAIGKAGLRDGPSPLGGGIEFESGDKASEVRSQMSHPLLQGCPEAFCASLYFHTGGKPPLHGSANSKTHRDGQSESSKTGRRGGIWPNSPVPELSSSDRMRAPQP